MRTGGLASLAALALLGAAGSGAQAVEIQYKPKVGETTKQRVMLAGRMSMEADSPLMQDFILDRAQVSATIDYTSKPISQSGDATEVKVQITQGEATITVSEGQEKTSLGSVESTMRVDRRLEVSEVDFTTEEDYRHLSDDAAGAMDAFGIGAGGWWDLVDVLYLPEGDVSVGAEWTYKDDDTSIGGGEEAPPLEVQFKLLELTTHAGRNCAKISTSYRYEFSEVAMPTGAEEGGRMTTSGLMSGEYLIYYDYENSVRVYREGSTGFDVTVIAEYPEMGEATVRTKIVMNVKASLVP
jgi:hypothetical protein